MLKVIPILLAALSIQINGERVKTELAITQKELSQGLMHREALAEGEGMLFFFDREKILSFWMKNTKIPLSIGFFNARRRLINIEEMEPGDLSFHYSKAPSLYALEVPQGWFKRHGIKPGMNFEWTESNQ